MAGVIRSLTLVAIGVFWAMYFLYIILYQSTVAVRKKGNTNFTNFMKLMHAFRITSRFSVLHYCFINLPESHEVHDFFISGVVVPLDWSYWVLTRAKCYQEVCTHICAGATATVKESLK